MSLVKKIYVAFIVIIAIAVCAGVMGWNTVRRMDSTLTRIVEFEMVAENELARIEQAAHALTVAQRTLLNSDVVNEARESQHAALMQQKDAILAAAARLGDVFTAGLARVSGWEAIQAEWQTVRPNVEKWMAAVDENDALIRQYEATTIINPDGLIYDLERYRSDHFQLVATLGEMLASEEVVGPKLNPADNLCEFGQWREKFIYGELPYSDNKAIYAALGQITGTHKIFHQAAARLQQMIGEGYEKNASAIDRLFVNFIGAARTTFERLMLISDEVERSRGLLRQATEFTMGPMLEMREANIAVLNKLVADNTANMDANVSAALAEADAGVKTMQTLIFAALGLGIVVILGVFIAIRRGLSRPLVRVIGELASDSVKVSSEAVEVETSSSSLSEGASSQSAALEQTSAAVEQITSMARKNLDNAKQANTEMQAASKQIQESADEIEQMSGAMGEIKESSEKISSILKTIEEIAFQTNLLALNAAVEAARAGDAGKGFAVVADEVRNLAGRSAQAVKDTSELITGTVDRINNGDVITRRIKEHFGVITMSADRITKMIEEIDAATSEQTLGMEQINQSVAQIDQINQTTATNAEANAGASVNLNHLSGDLTQQIEDLAQMLQTIIGSRGVPAEWRKNRKELKEMKRLAAGKNKKRLALAAPEAEEVEGN